ncbi:pyridoxamine 5'-phosphate oxidase-related FMN-binding [Candidatus Moduliflexus flocculans]|uniref:Pyridoxamine 5'-phosphate oxidase-related FMN-binding n=1 Tax=Candidatus Moduliflexus flocculans TaxID=1499966 RepID=A0A0S6VUE9_9BACT|nr:pyridoxamine 5'-phosphate oxidase-related FMN-binding [Candidatus Moduliflexus flocculans]
MRRQEKAVTDIQQIEQMIRRATICRLGLSDNGKPYIVPLCFGYENRIVYFHAAQAGRKLDILRNNPQVCVEFEADCELVRKEHTACCDWGMKYRSVIGFGLAEIVEDPQEKDHALQIIMRQYADSEKPFTFSPTSFERTAVIRVHIDELTGKIGGYPRE